MDKCMKDCDKSLLTRTFRLAAWVFRHHSLSSEEKRGRRVTGRGGCWPHMSDQELPTWASRLIQLLPWLADIRFYSVLSNKLINTKKIQGPVSLTVRSMLLLLATTRRKITFHQYTWTTVCACGPEGSRWTNTAGHFEFPKGLENAWQELWLPATLSHLCKHLSRVLPLPGCPAPRSARQNPSFLATRGYTFWLSTMHVLHTLCERLWM